MSLLGRDDRDEYTRRVKPYAVQVAEVAELYEPPQEIWPAEIYARHARGPQLRFGGRLLDDLYQRIEAAQNEFRRILYGG